MTTIELEIRNASGLHARPAALFVRTAGAQPARIRVRNLTRGTGDVDAKSLLSLMGLGVSQGHRIEISADGQDEQQALEAMRAAVEAGLGESVDEHGGVGGEAGTSGTDRGHGRAGGAPTAGG